jgi:fructokinase
LKKILCFGEVLWDVYPDKIEIGGAPFNVYHRLHSFGLDVNFISSVGKDKLGNNVINYFQKNNLSTNFLNVDKNYQTGQVLINPKSGEPDYDILENVAWDYIPFKKKYLKYSDDFDCIVYGSLGIRNDVSFMTLKRLLSFSKFKIFDLNLNLKFICVTNGSINSSIYNGNNLFTVDSFKVKSIDNLGAGDNFLACFINEFFIKKNSIKNSLKIASAYGALATTKIGASPSIKPHEINKILKN